MEEAPLSLKPELVSEESMGLDTPSSERTPEELSPSSDDYEVRKIIYATCCLSKSQLFLIVCAVETITFVPVFS